MTYRVFYRRLYLLSKVYLGLKFENHDASFQIKGTEFFSTEIIPDILTPFPNGPMWCRILMRSLPLFEEPGFDAGGYPVSHKVYRHAFLSLHHISAVSGERLCGHFPGSLYLALLYRDLSIPRYCLSVPCKGKCSGYSHGHHLHITSWTISLFEKTGMTITLSQPMYPRQNLVPQTIAAGTSESGPSLHGGGLFLPRKCGIFLL